MKRPSPETNEIPPSFKKQKTLRRKHHGLTNLQPGSAFVLENPQDGAVVSDQLTKGLAVALIGAGFDSADQEALASLQVATEEYMIRFTQSVATSMHHCRRTAPLPQDFINALASFHLTPSSLFADLKLPSPANITQAPLLPPSPTAQPIPYGFSPLPTATNSLDPEHEFLRPYVPKHLPPLPGTHSYKGTPVYATRETDARKIREESTQEGMQAEQALRKLLAASKAGKLKRKRTEGSDRTKKWQREDEVFKMAIDSVLGHANDSSASDKEELLFTSMDGLGEAKNDSRAVEDDIEGAGFVNYDRAYWRKSALDHALEAGS